MCENNIPNHTEYLWKIHSYLNEYIRFADTKAGLIIGLSSTLIGVLVTAKFQNGFGMTISGIAGLIGFICLVGGCACALWSVRPRLRSTQQTGFIFWKCILAYKQRNVFLSDILAQSAGGLEKHLAEHVYDLAVVCDSKYFWAGISLWSTSCGALICGSMYLLNLLPVK